MIRLVLIEDNILFRKGLACLLSQQSDMSVVCDLGGAADTVYLAAKAEPDVVLMDFRLAGSSGLDVAAQIKQRVPQAKCIMLTCSQTEEYVRTALRMGVAGYLLKDATVEELLIAVRSVARGKKYLSPDVSGQVVESFLHPENVVQPSSHLDLLTSRERGVLQLIAEGRTNRSAAEFLSVSIKTVEKHRANLMQKLGLRNATEMTLVAMELGLIERSVSFERLSHSANQAPAAHAA